MADEQQITLRDTISNAFDQHIESTEPAAPATTEQPQEKTDGRKTREHRPDGTFAPKQKDSAPQVPATARTGADQPSSAATPAVAEPEKPRPQRPSSWKKDYWDDWEKLDPKVADYILQRESEYAKGVSTYKTEWENAKPFLDAVAPYHQELTQFGIDPAQQFGRYVEIHKALALGNPQQKLGVLAKLAADYQIPLEGLLVRGQDGNVYFNQQLLQQQPYQAQTQAPDVEKIVDAKLTDLFANQQTQQFLSAKDAQGNTAHPHFDQVRETMAQLLEAGLADDLEGAYQKSLRMNDELWQQVQQSQASANEAQRQQKLKEDAERARRNAVSPRTATPAGPATGAKKGLRATIEEAYDSAVPGRV